MKYNLLTVLVTVLSFSSCYDKDFLTVAKETKRKNISSCQCPDGFKVNPAFDGCTKETIADPIDDPNAYPIIPGDPHGGYAWRKTFFEDGNASQAWPFLLEEDVRAVDSRSILLPGEEIQGVTPFWRNHIIGPDRVSIMSEMRHVWHTKTVCIDLRNEKNYSFFVGGDNNWKIRIDGNDYASCSSSYCFLDVRFLSQTLKSGKHLVELKYYDHGSYGALWYEIFDQPLASLKNVTSDAELRTIFSSKSLVGQKWDYSGEICPPGYSYDVCNLNKKCSKLEKRACLR